ncbi:MAG: cytochrome c maturation protein CcmE [Actinomycetes bacterium]|jgi:cytochrome c-type biogenesis protein CcmE|nr:cytochrome c maturation protein CcmE [Actinomycetes bacterium]
MNKRARNRLIGISVILLVVIAGALLFFTQQGAATNMTVAEIVKDPEAVGRRVEVTGTVVNGSWDKKTNPMTFKIREADDKKDVGPQITVVYTGGLPQTFGDGVEAIVTGDYEQGELLKSASMITKCPSKYESSTDAYQVTQLKERAEQMVNIPVKVAGVVKPGSLQPPGGAVRFIILNAEGASDELNIKFDGALSDEVKDDAKVVITGELDENGAYIATEVALEK